MLVPRFVVTPQQVDVSWILDFQAEEEQNCLEGVVTAVYEVSDEDVA